MPGNTTVSNQRNRHLHPNGAHGTLQLDILPLTVHSYPASFFPLRGCFDGFIPCPHQPGHRQPPTSPHHLPAVQLKPHRSPCRVMGGSAGAGPIRGTLNASGLALLMTARRLITAAHPRERGPENAGPPSALPQRPQGAGHQTPVPPLRPARKPNRKEPNQKSRNPKQDPNQKQPAQ